MAFVPVDAPASTTPRRSLTPVPQSLPAPTIYAADCTTPKATFNLGETVCAKATGATGLRFQWVDPDGFAVAATSITADPQNDTFQLPPTDQSLISGFFTANNLGRWRVNVITSRNSATTSAFFAVSNPDHPRVDLTIVNSIVGGALPGAGDPIQFAVTIVNNGPNDALNAHFDDTAFTNAIFHSLTQVSGPPFTCTGADCRIASLPNGAIATFILDFTAGSAGGVLGSTATVSSDTEDLNPKDNSSATPPITIGASSGPPSCTLTVTAPPPVTLSTGAGATSCGVTVSNLDATLGTGSAAHTCDLVGGVDRNGVPAGNAFPVGTTTITYIATDVFDNTASASQDVTVIDNTPPTISCPPPMTVEFSNASGAVVTFSPTATDNCGAPTVTSAPPSGSTFAIGTTTVTSIATDAASNNASCSFTVTVLGPLGVKQNVLADLVALRATVASDDDRKNLDRAIKDLQASVDSALWIDQVHLNHDTGSDAIDKERDCVKGLENIMKSKKSAIPDAVLLNAIGRIVKADRLLAEIAIKEAIAAQGRQLQIDEAQRDLSRGDSDAASEKFSQAIQQYSAAWQKAIEALGNGDNSQGK